MQHEKIVFACLGGAVLLLVSCLVAQYKARIIEWCGCDETEGETPPVQLREITVQPDGANALAPAVSPVLEDRRDTREPMQDRYVPGMSFATDRTAGSWY
ncbi:hypothetical protein AB1Y20_004410 [Prymnesium parvum]|uniref:Secreted protein n=1 Tax=Prymnesium parvum TaxID=97485 RepID=A0AB34IZ24_PRYPA